jgi:hypothetical protein
VAIRKKKLSSEDRVLERLKLYRCRALTLVPGEISREYNEVISNTVRQSKLMEDSGMPKQTVSAAIKSLMDFNPNVLVYRFDKDGTYIPNDVYNHKLHPSTVVHLGFKSENERFSGERLLDMVGASLLATSQFLEHVAISKASSDLTDGELRLHFTLGNAMLNLTIRKSVFEVTNARPFTLFLAQTNALDLSLFSFVPELDHLRSFDHQVAVLNLPTQSFHLPNHSRVPPQDKAVLSTPDFGNIALTFYPAGKEVWITQLFGSWSPRFAHLKDEHLIENQSNVPPVFNFDRWRRQGRIWPEALVKISKGQPPKLEPFFSEETLVRYLDGHGLKKISSTKLTHPKIFEIAPWLEVSRQIHTSGKTEDAGPTQIEAFRSHIDDLTWACNVPALLGFRQFHIAITR